MKQYYPSRKDNKRTYLQMCEMVYERNPTIVQDMMKARADIAIYKQCLIMSQNSFEKNANALAEEMKNLLEEDIEPVGEEIVRDMATCKVKTLEDRLVKRNYYKEE